MENLDKPLFYNYDTLMLMNIFVQHSHFFKFNLAEFFLLLIQLLFAKSFQF